MSTRNPTHGTKVTDSSAPEIEEGSGNVTSDSLAAESTRSGGGFSSNPESSATNPTSFSKTHASKLDATDSASSRTEASDDYPDGLDGQAKEFAVTDTTGSSTTGGKTSYAGVAPTYVDSQFVDTAGPRGKNLKEGGFDESDKKNSSWNAEIGSEEDPGRGAEKDFEGVKAVDGEGGSLGKGEGQFEALEDTEA